MHLPDPEILARIDRELPPISPRAVARLVQFTRRRCGADAAKARAIARAAGPTDIMRILDAWEGDLAGVIEGIADGEVFPHTAGSYEERILDERIHLRHLAEAFLRERDPATRIVPDWRDADEELWLELRSQLEIDGYTFADGKLQPRFVAPEADRVYRSELERLLDGLGLPAAIWEHFEEAERRFRGRDWRPAIVELRTALDALLETFVRRALEARPETLSDLERGEITRWWNCAQYLRRRGFFGREEQLDPNDRRFPGELRFVHGFHDSLSLKGAHGADVNDEDAVVALYTTQFIAWYLTLKFQRWATRGFPDLPRE